MPFISRRDILKLSAKGLLGLSGIIGIGFIIRFLGYIPDPPPSKRFELGPSINFLIGTRTIIKSIPAILIHSQAGYKAISLTCQHLGCTVDVKADEFICPCHGSRYDKDGKVLNGPSQNNLPPLRVEITADEQVIIYKS